ncbi:unannotated protein [freshwater metagenome]|uniref:Unannotated protein n=1 Tax=freshwater metagenome TaxID=449393 RepID=A0A6J6KHX4_9ZZZZ
MKTNKPAIKKLIPSATIAQPAPIPATMIPPATVPVMFAPFAPKATTEFADCKSSSSTISGIKPAKAGHHNAFSEPLMNAMTAKLKTVAVPLISITPFAITNALSNTSDTPTTNARGNRSASTPPKSMNKTMGPSCAAITILKDEAVAPSSPKTPKASAMGPRPFPKFEMMRAINKVLNAGRNQSRLKSASTVIAPINQFWDR